MTISIVIPTYNSLETHLRPCLESILAYTSSYGTEIIVVANGCQDETEDHVRRLSAANAHIKLISSKEALGYTKATNLGIQASTGEYVVLLNDDTVLLPQEKDTWLKMLLAPFSDCSMGITGPVKFTWDCHGNTRNAMAFWCVMIRRELFEHIGLLDEVYSPGMGEDGDFSIQAEKLGYKLLQVPNNETHDFLAGIPQSSQQFPIYHLGNGTFGFISSKDEVIARNTGILNSRYGSDLECNYKFGLTHPCDINELFPLLRKYASKSSRIVEMGVRGVVSTHALLSARPTKMVSYDIETSPNIFPTMETAKRYGIDFTFIEQDVLKVDIDETDMLFIDTLHTASQLAQELKLHAPKVRKYILLHDTYTFGEVGEDGAAGINIAVADFLSQNPDWAVIEKVDYSNGLTVLGRIANPLISIVIPTHNHLDDALKPCIERVLEFTNLEDKEIIVVANGCSDDTRDFLNRCKSVTTVWSDAPLGYIGAVNHGIRAARGEFIVLLDNDSHLLPQHKDQWIQILSEPFAYKLTGMSGPFVGSYPEVENPILLHSGCAMYRKSLLEELGLFDEAYAPGFLGDTDLCIRIEKAGYRIHPVGVPNIGKTTAEGLFEISFPIYHPPMGTTTMHRDTMLSQLKRNRILFLNRHAKNRKVNIVELQPPQPNISIVIPTYNRCSELLKPCVESIKTYTNLDDKEVIIVANGCTDETREYVTSLGSPFRLIWSEEAIGYTRATNLGIKESRGKNVLLLNNDTVLLPQQKETWINMLLQPLATPDIGASGPLMLHDDYADRDVLIFFCVLIKKEVFDKIGLLNEIYSPGGGEDIDFSARMQDAGYRCVEAPQGHTFDNQKVTNTGLLPIFHIAEGTFKHIPEYAAEIIKRNGMINLKKYNKNVKLNMGSGGCHVPGFISVDLYDDRAHVIMNVCKPDFDDNFVSEIMASHLIEHINPYKVEDTLKEWNRILKPGGRLVMEMPDIERLCQEFVKLGYQERFGILNCVYGSVNTTDKGTPSDITAPHMWGWYPESMFYMLQACGFTNIEFKPEQYPHPGFNFRVECIKPSPPTGGGKEVLKEIKSIEVGDEMSVSAEVSTKGRYETTLPVALMSIVNQSHRPKEILIFDDDEHRDLRNSSVYSPILAMFSQRGINWKVIFGEKKGQTRNHQKAIEIAESSLIWRVDDDDSPEPGVLASLVSRFHGNADVGAVGGRILIPGDHVLSAAACSANIEDIYALPHLQWSNVKGVVEVDHLNNSFLFRRSNQYSYDLDLSIVGHREETIFSYRIKKAGLKVLVDGDCITWHLKSPSGGIRSQSDKNLWDSDEKIFTNHINNWSIRPKKYKLIVLDCGLGDHFVFKNVLPDIKKKYSNIILAVCYQGVFDDKDVRIISIADGKHIDPGSVAPDGSQPSYNVYKFCYDNKWTGTLEDAYSKMYR